MSRTTSTIHVHEMGAPMRVVHPVHGDARHDLHLERLWRDLGRAVREVAAAGEHAMVAASIVVGSLREATTGWLRADGEPGPRPARSGLHDEPNRPVLTVVPPEHLSRREVEVLRLVAEGRSNREIGMLLFISRNTAANHVRAILQKTGTANRAEAVAFAGRHGLLG